MYFPLFEKKKSRARALFLPGSPNANTINRANDFYGPFMMIKSRRTNKIIVASRKLAHVQSSEKSHSGPGGVRNQEKSRFLTKIYPCIPRTSTSPDVSMLAVCTTRAGVVRIRGPLALAPRRQYIIHFRQIRLIVLPHYETHKTHQNHYIFIFCV